MTKEEKACLKFMKLELEEKVMYLSNRTQKELNSLKSKCETHDKVILEQLNNSGLEGVLEILSKIPINIFSFWSLIFSIFFKKIDYTDFFTELDNIIKNKTEEDFRNAVEEAFKKQRTINEISF